MRAADVDGRARGGVSVVRVVVGEVRQVVGLAVADGARAPLTTITPTPVS